jgi:large subunit ribosomal protein L22
MAEPETQVPVYTAKHRFARLTARKARLVADEIRGESVNKALEKLQFAPQRAAAFYLKVVRSAMANAAQDEAVDVNRLVIVDARADDGPMQQGRMRWRPGPQGRAMPFKKMTSHLTVRVAEAEELEEAPARGRKAPRRGRKQNTKAAGQPAGEQES